MRQNLSNINAIDEIILIFKVFLGYRLHKWEDEENADFGNGKLWNMDMWIMENIPLF